MKSSQPLDCGSIVVERTIKRRIEESLDWIRLDTVRPPDVNRDLVPRLLSLLERKEDSELISNRFEILDTLSISIETIGPSVRWNDDLIEVTCLGKVLVSQNLSAKG